MHKKFLAWIIALVLLVLAVPATAFATQVTEPTTPPQTETVPSDTDTVLPEQIVIPQMPEESDPVKRAALESYYKTLESTNMPSMRGYCGKMVGYQLMHMGVNSGAITGNGNQQYDLYADMRRTSGGYYVGVYPAEQYTLQEALEAITQNGTVDVTNILVGFEWTASQDTTEYGHVMVINAIQKGKVYFMESYDTRYAPEGMVNVCSIAEFADMYSKWAFFEGAIHFSKDLAQSSRRYGTDVFVLPRFAVTMRSAPCLVGSNGCKVLRTVSAGERLRVTSVVENADGELYYCVQEKDRTGYIVAQATVLERTNYEDLSIKKLTLPAVIKSGEKNTLSGTLQAKYGKVGAVEFVIEDAAGNVLLQHSEEINRRTVNLSDFQEILKLDTLPNGRYVLHISGQTAAAYVQEDELTYSNQQVLLESPAFWVGEQGEEPPAPKTAKEEKPDGWCWQEGKWYVYRMGKPITGWYVSLGVTYYLDENGAVTTGWQTVDGVKRYFTDTGAMSVGWLRSGNRLRYSLSDGCFVEGWQTIGASRYFFKNGYAQTSGTRVDEGVKYKFQSDGKAIPMN